MFNYCINIIVQVKNKIKNIHKKLINLLIESDYNIPGW